MFVCFERNSTLTKVRATFHAPTSCVNSSRIILNQGLLTLEIEEIKLGEGRQEVLCCKQNFHPTKCSKQDHVTRRGTFSRNAFSR